MRELPRREALWLLLAAAGAASAPLSGCRSDGEAADSDPVTTSSEPPVRYAWPADPPAGPVNVLLVFADDMRWDELPFLPVASGLASAGVEFSNARQPTPACVPARAGLHRGQYANGPNGHGISLGSVGRARIEPESLAPWLHAAGVYTGMVGKYFQHRADAVRPGWDVWRTTFGPDANSSRGYAVVTNETGEVTRIEPDELQEDYLAGEVSTFVETAPEPWFVEYAAESPHVPLQPSASARDAWDDFDWFAQDGQSWGEADVSDKPSWIRAQTVTPTSAEARTEQQLRLAELTDLDRGLGRILARLAASGRLDRTYVIFTSDNGVHLGEHRLPTLRKNTPYDVSMRVPLVVAGPGLESGVVDVPVNAAADVTATVLALEDADPTVPLDGVDLLGLAADPAGHRDRAVLGYRQQDPAFDDPIPTAEIVYTVDRKLVRYRDVAEEDRYEAYDLDADPAELDNWAADPERRAERDQLEARLDELLVGAD